MLVGSADVVVIVGTGAGAGEVSEPLEDDEAVVVVVVVVLVVGSLQPNQPGVLQDFVELELVEEEEVERGEEVVVVVVVDSSRHPHHPGVLHVSVLVRELVLELLELVVVSVPLLSKNFQSTQSAHSTSSSQLGTVSYFSSTSLMTPLILCVPIPTRHPRSPTVS